MSDHSIKLKIKGVVHFHKMFVFHLRNWKLCKHGACTRFIVLSYSCSIRQSNSFCKSVSNCTYGSFNGTRKKDSLVYLHLHVHMCSIMQSSEV